VRVHRAGEHALELELLDLARMALDVGLDRAYGLLVVLGLGQVQQLRGAGQSLAQCADAVDRLVQQGTLTAEGLGAFGAVPDGRVLELPLDFLQALALGVVVKETPSAHPADR
jgi:hypothetical protein